MSLSKQRIALGLLAATGGLGAAALGYQLYRTRKAREYLLFTARDALRAIGMTLRSKHIRNTVVASVVLTLLLRRAGVGIRRRHMIPTLFSIIWYLHYRMNIVEHRACCGAAPPAPPCRRAPCACPSRRALQALVLEPGARGAGQAHEERVPARDMGLEPPRHGAPSPLAALLSAGPA